MVPDEVGDQFDEFTAVDLAELDTANSSVTGERDGLEVAGKHLADSRPAAVQ